MNSFSIREAIRFGWDTFKKRPWFFIGTFFVVSFLSSVSFQAEDVRVEDISAAAGVGFFLVGLALAIVNILAKMGGTVFLIKAHDAPESARFKDIWAPHPFWKFVFASILKGIVLAAPLVIVFLVALIVSAEYFMPVTVILGILAFAWLVYAGVRLAFVELLVMEKRMSPMAALKESRRITEGEFWRLVLFMLALGGVMILGVLALVVGLLVAIPVGMFAYAHVYRALLARHAETPSL